MNISELSQLIASRRSVFPKMYTDKKVEDKDILQILENANWAPTHKNTEPWRFHIITGDALLDLGECMAKRYRSVMPEMKFKQAKFEKLRDNPAKASHVIVICMKRDKEESIPVWEEIAAVSCAVQNMWLSCTALGLGSYWSTPSSIDSLNDFLFLEPGVKCLGLFYIGHPKIDVSTLPAKRGDIREKIMWRGRE